MWETIHLQLLPDSLSGWLYCSPISNNCLNSEVFLKAKCVLGVLIIWIVNNNETFSDIIGRAIHQLLC